MVLADAIWTDPGTGKKTILGTFSALFGKEFPLHLGQLAVYVALTDGTGKVPITLKIVDVDEERDPVRTHAFSAEFPDPIAILEGTLHLGDVIFPEPGEYRIQLFAENELIIERRLVVIKMPPEDAK